MRKLWNLGLVPKFAVLSLVLMTALGTVVAQKIATDVEARHVEGARDSAVLITELGFRPRLTPEMLRRSLTVAERADLSSTLRSSEAGRTIVRIKVWNRAGTVVFSDDERLIGRTFSPTTDRAAALDGAVEADVTELDGREYTRERSHGKAVEVYVPIVFAGIKRPAGVFELYLPYAPIEAAIRDESRGLLLLFGAGLTLVWLALFRIVRGAARRLRAQAEENRHQALHDALTGLPNRLLFTDRVGQAIRHTHRASTGVAVMLMDLDGFKEINDTLGHRSGDSVLEQIGPRLEAQMRSSDTVARLGGDEFGILLAGVADIETARRVARKLLKALENPFVVDALSIEVEASIGIAHFPDDGVDPTTLMQHADVAMYSAKDSRTGIEVYASASDPHSRDRLTLMGELRGGLDRGEFVLHYQPKIDLVTGGVRGVEALVRWEHPVHGLIPPGDFIPATEHTGLMRPLTAYVLEQAASQCNSWRDEGYGLTIAVNLSTRNLHDLHLPEAIRLMLERWLLPPGAFQLEITESAIMGDPVRAMGVANALRGLGVQLSIDDFGTGFSSLSYLKQFPVDEIKIDKSFVSGMDKNADDHAIVRSTITLAHNLGLDVVAEGIETPDSLAQLTALGCDMAQGFLLCRPMTGAALTDWFHTCGREIASAHSIFRDERPLTDSHRLTNVSGIYT